MTALAHNNLAESQDWRKEENDHVREHPTSDPVEMRGGGGTAEEAKIGCHPAVNDLHMQALALHDFLQKG